MPAAGYTTTDTLRAEGVPASVSDARLIALGDLAKRYIDRVTGLWFDLRAFGPGTPLTLDGSGTSIQELPAPPKTLTAVRIDGTTVTASEYVVYNRRPETGAEDFWYPRIEFKVLLRTERAFGAQAVPRFASGSQNVELEGVFGFVEADDTTPQAIQRACALLVVGMTTLLTQGPAGYMQSETLGHYSYTVAEGAVAQLLTGNPELGMLLVAYTRVPAMVAV